MIFARYIESAQVVKYSCQSRCLIGIFHRQTAKRFGIGLAAWIAVTASSSVFAANCFKDSNSRNFTGLAMNVTIKVKAEDPSDNWQAFKRSYVIGQGKEKLVWDKLNPDKGIEVGDTSIDLFKKAKVKVKFLKLVKRVFQVWFVQDDTLRLNCSILIGVADAGVAGPSRKTIAPAIECQKNPGSASSAKKISDETYFTCNRNFKPNKNEFVFRFVLKDR